MKKVLLTGFVWLSMFVLVPQASAQTTRFTSPTPIPAVNPSSTPGLNGATDSAELATAAAEVVPSPSPKPDITETQSTAKDELTAFLEANPVGELSWHNPLQHGLRDSISRGLPANIVVLVILFPLIATIIAASRHLIGLQGFGVYVPAVLSVAFVSTGIVNGLLMFVAVLLAASIFKFILKYLRLQYLPRTALLLWGVSLMILLLLVAASLYGFGTLLTISIFPLLIVMLLTENFMETQMTSSLTQTLQLTLETLIVAVLCSLLISNQTLQKAVLLRPELTFLLVALFNLAVGRYSGLRLLEYLRFRSVIEG